MTNALPSLAITGSTGALGGQVAAELAKAGLSQRLLVRNPAKAPSLANTEIAVCSYGDGAAAETALTGVETLLMVSAAESDDRLEQHRTFVDAAAAAGVRHLVYTSFLGAAADATFTLARDHYATEEHIKASGMAWTFLRDNFYADVMADFVGDDGVIRGPAGDGRVSLVARSDVARCAVAILQDPARHAHKSYELTGPDAVTLTEVAAILRETQGRDITFHNETIPEAYESRKAWPAPDWQYDAWVSTYTAIASGKLAAVSNDLEKLTGRKPLSVAELFGG
jgi:NAD(P)H dehydrogenase (quinone)